MYGARRKQGRCPVSFSRVGNKSEAMRRNISSNGTHPRQYLPRGRAPPRPAAPIGEFSSEYFPFSLSLSEKYVFRTVRAGGRGNCKRGLATRTIEVAKRIRSILRRMFICD
ncbi:hypothetical protein EVAR_82451_1 [Eumeta japonica]|uniref:Uncharacterized protein n=1 Tax=Eumeta variegata TaxID=151549 RepID=A0A4C1X807_EUMVA|nr:hypothetical protein EVAR_82451_1 [Eumeta japonica]